LEGLLGIFPILPGKAGTGIFFALKNDSLKLGQGRVGDGHQAFRRNQTPEAFPVLEGHRGGLDVVAKYDDSAAR